MRLTNLLVSGLLCLAPVAALGTPLEPRSDTLATFTYEVHILVVLWSLALTDLRQVVPGIFIQDDPATIPSQAGPVSRLGRSLSHFISSSLDPSQIRPH